MQLKWNEKTIKWFCNASEYTGYDDCLSDILLKYINVPGSICDMGCGIGLVDIKIAEKLINRGFTPDITCIDISEAAIAGLKKMIPAELAEYINPLCMDGRDSTGKWDTVMALFHGGDNVIENYYDNAEKTLILADFKSRIGKFGPKDRKEPKGSDADSIKRKLDELGLGYQAVNMETEHGQPFQDFDEASDFVKTYTTSMPEKELTDYLYTHLVRTGRDDFPFYLPKRKEFTFFIISK